MGYEGGVGWWVWSEGAEGRRSVALNATCVGPMKQCLRNNETNANGQTTIFECLGREIIDGRGGGGGIHVGVWFYRIFGAKHSYHISIPALLRTTHVGHCLVP